MTTLQFQKRKLHPICESQRNNGAFVQAGVSIIPLRLDGSKAPSIPGWKQYQDRLPTDAEVNSWFKTPAGAAVICGAVSGGIEVLDFDYEAETVFPAWAAMIDPILCRLPIVETPGDGYHIYYRCPVVCGNQKIANDEDRNVLIESRGNGGYVVSVTSPATVHAKNYPYVQVAGPVLPELPVITPDERLTLWRAARTFDKSMAKQAETKKLIRRSKPRQPKLTGGRLTPWDDFNSRGDWAEVLGRHNWTTPDGIHWRHPNAKSGHKHSATLREATSGDFVLHVFTTSTRLEPNKSHSLFNVLKEMDFNGNAKTTTAKLRKAGYGS